MPETSLLPKVLNSAGTSSHYKLEASLCQWKLSLSGGRKSFCLGPWTSSESSSLGFQQPVLPWISSGIYLDTLWVISLALPAGVRTVARGKLILWCPCKWIKKSFQIQLRKVFQVPVNSDLSMLNDSGSKYFPWQYLENKHSLIKSFNLSKTECIIAVHNKWIIQWRKF